MTVQHTALPGSSVGELATTKGLNSVMGLTLSAVGWETLSSFISKPFPFVSTCSFLLSKTGAAFPTSSSNGTPSMCLLQAHQLSQTPATTFPAGLTEGLHNPCPAATPPSTLWPSAPGPPLLPNGFRQDSSRVGGLAQPKLRGPHPRSQRGEGPGRHCTALPFLGDSFSPVGL